MKTKGSKHLDIYDREAIMSCLNSNMSLKQISDCIFKDERTISKEIKKRRNKTENGRFDYLFGGKEKSFADKYIICKRCSRYPYVCNGCPNLKNCNYKYKFKYNAQEAQENYEIILKESRKGLDCSLEEKIHFDSVLKKGIENGQSVFHIVKSNPNIRYSISSTYRLINSEQTVTQRIDLIRAVKLKPRKKYAQKNNKSDKQELRKGRTYKDFLTRVNNEFLPSITQTDTVESVIEGSHKVLFTIHFTGTHFMVAFILDSKKRELIDEKMNFLKSILTQEEYVKLFKITLTDRGTEFTLPESFENYQNKKVIDFYYCDSYASYQKGAIEENHTLIRRVIRKSIIFDNLVQKDIDLLLSHINSYKRDSLHGFSPYELAKEIYGEDIIKKLGIVEIDPNLINLTPKLLNL